MRRKAKGLGGRAAEGVSAASGGAGEGEVAGARTSASVPEAGGTAVGFYGIAEALLAGGAFSARIRG